MHTKELATRLRMKNDFEFYARTCLNIRTKDGDIKPLALNEGQMKLLEVIDAQIEQYGLARVICLKGRQMGISTFVEAYLYFRASQEKAKKAIVVTHKADSTDAL